MLSTKNKEYLITMAMVGARKVLAKEHSDDLKFETIGSEELIKIDQGFEEFMSTEIFELTRENLKEYEGNPCDQNLINYLQSFLYSGEIMLEYIKDISEEEV